MVSAIKTDPGNSAPRIAVVMPTWIGDACMATPTLRALRSHFPRAKITMISRPIIKELIETSWGAEPAWVDECMLVTKQGSDVAHSRVGLTKACRERGIELAILLTNSFWSAAVMRLAGVRRIVGYDRDARGWLLTDRVMVPRVAGRLQPISAVDYYLELAQQVGCDSPSRSMQLHVRQEDKVLANQLWRELGLSDSKPTLVINSNAATEPARIWPEDRVRELALRVATELDWQVLLHCGPKERDAANRTAAEANHPQVASMGIWQELPIGLSKAVLQRAALVLSSDSGPRHMAVALNRRVITLFGPTDPAWTRTYNHPEILLCAAESGPASEPPAIANISVNAAFAAIQQGLAAESSTNSRIVAA